MKRQPWLIMKLKLFYIFSLFVCPQCEIMRGVMDMKQEQDPNILKDFLCIHSKVSSEIVSNWKEIWSIDNDINRLPQRFNHSEDKIKICLGKGTHKHTLVSVMLKNEVTLLYTTGQQGFERCSKHTSQKCKCYWFFINTLERRKKGRENEENGEDDDNEDTNDDDNIDYEYEKNDYGEKLKHYNDKVKYYHKLYGYNETPILYPLEEIQNSKRNGPKKLMEILSIQRNLSPNMMKIKYVFIIINLMKMI